MPLKNLKTRERREFLKLAGTAATLSMLDPLSLMRALGATTRNAADRVSYQAYASVGSEGSKAVRDIEGEIPKALRGTLYRVTPGQKNNYGVPLNHLFDGDAFLAAFTFSDDGVNLRTRFLDTPQRQAEIAANRMLYHEFGTAAPLGALGFKNQPNINVIPWDRGLLALSEGAHPFFVDATTLSCGGEHDFKGTLPSDVSFTAHPKIDPMSGDGYAFGIHQGADLALKIYRMNRSSGTLTELYSIPQDRFYLIHDMMVAQEHLVFVVPSVSIDLAPVLLGKAPFADLIHFSDQIPSRIIVVRKDQSAPPFSIDLPPSMVFHHGNAFEKNGRLYFDSMLTSDASLLDLVYAWSKDQLPEIKSSVATRFCVNLSTQRLESRDAFGSFLDLPRFDPRQAGQDARYLYTGVFGDPRDRLRFSGICQQDFRTGAAIRVEAPPQQIWGEPVFVPAPGSRNEDDGWIVALNFDNARSESFVEIRDAQSLDFVARLWTGQRFAPGFHGSFVPV